MNVCLLGSYAKALVMTVDRIPVEGETVHGREFRQTFGGKGSDMAVQAARLGSNVSYVGVVGNDDFGKEFVELMESEAVKIEALRITDEQPTGVGFIVKDEKAQNMIVVDKGANELFNEIDVLDALSILKESLVTLTQFEIPVDTALFGLKKAKENDNITILNPAPAIEILNYDLSTVDVLTPNESEARTCVGVPPSEFISNKEVAKKLMKTGCKAIVMTLGARGAEVFTETESYFVDPVSVDVVDSNGAGDSFNGALAVALSQGKTLKQAVYFANTVAALSCTRWETVPSYFKQEEVENFLK